MDRDLQIRDAQYRKSLGIAFFNATNSAIELAKIDGLVGKDAESFIRKWREWFLEEHKNYYATVIAKVGTNFSPAETIALLQTAQNREMLQNIWLTLSEDERHDETIIVVKDELKAKFEKADEKPTKTTKK